MNEKKCGQCAEKVKLEAARCKHCGHEFSAEEMAAASAEAKKQQKAGLFGCLGLVLLLGFCGYIGGEGDSTAAIPDQPAPTAKADVSTFYRKVMVAVAPCDRAGARVAAAGRAGDPVAMYQSAGAMEAACLPAASDIGKIEVPASVGKASHAKLTETKEICENTYSHRWASAGKIKKALDENGAVGRLAELKEATDLVQTGIMACVAGLVSEAMTLGATEADLGMSGTDK